MTRKEALAYLNFNEIQDDLADHYEAYLFNHKQFFISSPISKKIFEKRFEKIEKAQLAYEVLGSKSEQEILTKQEVHFNNEIKSNWSWLNCPVEVFGVKEVEAPFGLYNVTPPITSVS